MIAILSPAKTMDVTNPISDFSSTTPIFKKEADDLARQLHTMSRSEIQNMMKISESLSDKVVEEYQNWNSEESLAHQTQSIFAFKGEVYRGLDASSLSNVEINFTQDNLRILSGLYGILRPLDLVQSYRLEMGSKLSPSKKAKNLYQYWGDQITDELKKELKKHKNPTLINLASNEYFKVIHQKKLTFPIITIHFKEYKEGTYKTIAVYAKKARGLFAQFMAKQQIQEPESLQLFSMDGYGFDSNQSSEFDWVFTR